MIAPTSCLPSGASRRTNRSRIGMTKERVFPEPVTACVQLVLSLT